MSDITADWPVVGPNDSGAGQDGEILDLALFNLIKTAINNQVYSSTNPSVTPKALIDEVVTARGSLGSLDARLDASLNEDGTLKTQASLVTAAQAKTLVPARNVAVNGDVDNWSAGPAAAPDGWVLSGAGGTIARTGPSESDPYTFGAGQYTAKMTRAGTDLKFTETVLPSGTFAFFNNCKSQKFSVLFKGRTAIASHLRITVDDGATQTSSSYHTGSNAEETLSVTHTISSSATKLEVYAEVKGSNGDAYVGGFVFSFSDLAPADWNALSQQLGNRLLFRTATAVSALTSETDFMKANLQAGVVDYDGKVIRLVARGTFAANANNKTLRIYLGGLQHFTNFTIASNNFSWELRVEITRTGSATQNLKAILTIGALVWTAGAVYIDRVTGTRDFATNLELKITGQSGTATGDVTFQEGYVEALA